MEFDKLESGAIIVPSRRLPRQSINYGGKTEQPVQAHHPSAGWQNCEGIWTIGSSEIDRSKAAKARSDSLESGESYRLNCGRASLS